MNRGKAVLVVAVGFFAIYILAAPYITVYQMKSAAENHDGEALSEHIEFPSVRQSLKDQINVMFAKTMAESEEMKDNPFAALGTAFAGVMVDKMVDAYVTPAGITQLMAGEKPISETIPDEGHSKSSSDEPWSNASWSYESLSKFVVKVNGKDSEEGKFVLRRRGLDWMLTEIIVPMD